jgi:AcrR family transcriptional regulator
MDPPERDQVRSDAEAMEALSRPARERLLRAVIQAVAEHGYRQTTIAQVCARAGVSRATFYEHFADKEECFLAAYESMDRRLQEFVLAALEGVEGVGDRVRAGTGAFFAGLAADDDVTRVAILEVNAAGPRARAAYERSVYGFAPIVEEARRLVDRGEELPPNIARVVVSSVAAVVFQEVVANRTRQLPRLLPEMVYLVLVPFVGHERALEERAVALRMGRSREQAPVGDEEAGA